MPDQKPAIPGSAGSLPWTLPALEPGVACSKNLIASHFPGGFGRVRLPSLAQLLRSDETILEMRVIEKGAHQLGEPCVILALSLGPSPRSRRLALGLPLREARLLVDRVSCRAPGENAPQLSTGELGILMYALDRAARDWTQAGGAMFYVRGSLYDADQLPEYLGSKPGFFVSARLASARLSFPVHLWFASLGGAPPRSGREIASSTRRWPVTVRIQIGATRIEASQLTALAAGDVVICDELEHPGGDDGPSRCTLRCGAWRRRASWRGLSALAIEDIDQGHTMQNKSPTELKTTVSPPLQPREGDLEVEMSVEIGRLRLSVDQAGSLMAGTVLTLDRDIGAEVSLVVGDRAVASGRLVDYEGRLAVELTEVTT